MDLSGGNCVGGDPFVERCSWWELYRMDNLIAGNRIVWPNLVTIGYIFRYFVGVFTAEPKFSFLQTFQTQQFSIIILNELKLNR